MFRLRWLSCRRSGTVAFAVCQARFSPSVRRVAATRPKLAVINWKEEELNNLIQNFAFPSDWGVQFPIATSTALDAPPGYITLYVDFFQEGNFRLPMSKFVGEVLTGYGIHISQINALGLHRITHFEFICRAQRIVPTFEKFNVFYYVTYIGGFYSFNSRTSGAVPCSRDPPKSLHDWKQKFFYIRRGVIPIDIHYRSESEGVPRVAVSISFASEEWYKTLTRKATPMIQLDENALFAAGMSLLWMPRDPRVYPVYAHKRKAGYSLMNVFDPKVAGGMAVAAFPEGEPSCTARIKDNFLHPTPESMSAYNNVILGFAETETDVDLIPTREEPIILSSEESTGSSHGLTHLSSRAGPEQGLVQEPAGEGVSTPPTVDPSVVAEQKEARRKKREEKKTEEKKTAKEPTSAPNRKRSSNVKLLDHVVVSDSLSGLDVAVKQSAPGPDDKVTLTEMVAKKQKILADKKRELDEQAPLAFSEKKMKVMGETVAPSESEVDLGVFSKKFGNLLKKIYEVSSTPRGMILRLSWLIFGCLLFLFEDKSLFLVAASAKSTRSGAKGTAEGDAGKKVIPNVAPGVVIQEGDPRVEGAETEWESSKATPQGTIYTRRGPSTPGGGGHSGSR
ncbi:hypothetical protein Hanom_Chr03g00243681 [Helianthus anomalus]